MQNVYSNIVLVLTNNIGGLHSFRKEVMKAIVDTGLELYISEPDDDVRVDYFKSIGCHIIKTDFNRRGMNPVADIKLMLQYRCMIKKLKPVAVLTYTIKPNIYGGIACRLTKTPQLANVTGLGDAMENGGWLQKMTVGLYRMGISKARRVFFQNSNNRETCIRLGIADEHSKLLPGSGVNLHHHACQPYPKDDDKIKFLYIGRLLKDKGIEEYFAAAKAIKKKYPDTEFQVLGKIEGSYQFQLAELARVGVIDYLGVTTDVRSFIGDVHCTVMPSYHEGMSNVNLESAANGRPVITTNVPGCRETIDDGETGFLVEAKSTESLIDAIERFLALPYNQKQLMGQMARKKVEREFDRQIVVDAYLKEIKSLANVNLNVDERR
jgi:galacturonosyltransferase